MPGSCFELGEVCALGERKEGQGCLPGQPGAGVGGGVLAAGRVCIGLEEEAKGRSPGQASPGCMKLELPALMAKARQWAPWHLSLVGLDTQDPEMSPVEAFGSADAGC